MKIFSTNSRFSYGILLVLLISSISGAFISLHNQLSANESKTPILSIIFMLTSIIVGIIFFQRTISLTSAAERNALQLENLKRSIQESKKESENQEIKEKEEVNKSIDFESEIRSLLPQGEYENKQLYFEKLLSNIAKNHDIIQGITFLKDTQTGIFSFLAGYAFFSETTPQTFTEGETLAGQVAKNKVVLNLNEVPEGYISVLSGLGQGTPKHLLIVPILNEENESIGTMELASFKEFSDISVKTFEHLGNSLSKHILTIGNSTEE